YLNILLEDNSPFPKQDSPIVVISASNRPLGRFITWHFLRENFEQLKYLVAETFHWGNVILSVTESFNTKTQLEELRSFKASREGQFDSGQTAVIQAIENAKTNVKWMKRNFKRINAWLSAHTI
ncbi:aminopeptidase N, partial [Biomphalaria glabrata]